MVYNREEVTRRALEASGRPNTPGYCQAWTRGIIGVHSVGDVDGDGDADAVDGWKSEPDWAKHFDRNPPAGVPVAWSGGRNGYGHRAISAGNGRIVSTDAGGIGRISTVPLDWVEKNWGMKYLGWSETMSGVKIPVPQEEQKVDKFSELEVISWNVYYKTNPREVRAELIKMIDRWNPDLFYLYESINLYGELEGLGYKVRQLKPRATKKGHTSHNGNIVVLIRNGLKIKNTMIARMSKYWKAPRTGRNQDPRVYRAVKIKKQGVTWKTAGVHLPFGQDAQRESATWIRKFIKITHPIRPVVVFGDYNRKEKKVESSIADPTKSKVAGDKIDLAVYKNCQLVKEHNLGKRGSDHPAWRYVFKKRRPVKK